MYKIQNSDEMIIFDETLYEQRYTIERTNAWIDSYITFPNRFETTVVSWVAFNYIAFITIFFKKIYKKSLNDFCVLILFAVIFYTLVKDKILIFSWKSVFYCTQSRYTTY